MTNDLLTGLPGEDLLREGLTDVSAGRRTIPACLVAIGSPHFRRAGLLTANSPALVEDAELQLYGLLQAQGGDAYSRYNALLRELVSFERALNRRVRELESASENRRVNAVTSHVG